MSDSPKTVDWPALFFDSAASLPEKLLAVANRRFAGTADAESAYNFALEQVSQDNWQRLQAGYKGTGSAEGFLRITFVRLLEEYAVRKYGKQRPPLWVKRLGTMWVRVYELLCLNRLLPESIVDNLTARDEFAPDLVRDAITEVRGRIPGCGQYRGEYLTDDRAQTPADLQPGAQEPDAELEETELVELLGSLGSLLADGDQVRDEAHDPKELTLSQRRDVVRRQLAITDNERLILRLIYQDGYSIPKAAKAIRLHEQKVRRTHKALMEKIRSALTAAGLDAVTLDRFAR